MRKQRFLGTVVQRKTREKLTKKLTFFVAERTVIMPGSKKNPTEEVLYYDTTLFLSCCKVPFKCIGKISEFTVYDEITFF